MRLNAKSFQKVKSIIQMQTGFCCYMICREDWSKVTQTTGLNPVASSPVVTAASLFQGGPAGDLEQIDAYLEALLKEDNLLFQKAFVNKVTTDTGHHLLLEKKENISQN